MKALIIFLSLAFVAGCVTGGSAKRAVAWDLRQQFRYNCDKYEDKRTCLDLYQYLKRRTKKGKGDRRFALWCGSNCSDNNFSTCVFDCVDKAMY